MAVPGRLSPKAEGMRTEVVAAGQRYLRALRAADAEGAVLLPDGAAIGEVPALLERFDGLLLLGGGDLDPTTYGSSTRHESVYGVDADHDTFELAMVRAALAADLPVLAVCRGFQLLNVVLGGTLTQHITDGETTVRHRGFLHEVELVAGCRAALAMGTTRPSCWSMHHQALDRLGDGLFVTGRAADGCVEAVERPGSWVVGVQWHPEDTAADDPAQQGLFDAFVAECARRRCAAV